MREKGGDCYYHVCVKGSVPVVLCSASNIVSMLECMVRVRIYPIILYDLHTYILTYYCIFMGTFFLDLAYRITWLLY